MPRPVKEKEWIGMTINEANNKAKSLGYTCRIVEEDGKAFILPYSNKPNVLNLRLRDGKVVALYT